ncbi:hypothetical protein C2845_PM03G00270 [Panicum miliaceum]|uniref:DUF3615 domain-containing protein n=1 Tax=Panicum miliaceum TaxID=4540 RepID=A0A3L6TG40_PANMI|nr:hypothetical protein C2845_PM03G00270 [Panicum miliaceum]
MASRKRAATAVEDDDDIGCAFLHELSGEEQLRLRTRHLERKRKDKKLRDKGIRPAPSMRTEEDRDAFVMGNAHHALRYYNARHPGGEFDPVKPLMEARVRLRNHTWYHVNFWARSRSNNPGKIKRFFAELRYKQDRHDPIVETCTIIEEPLCRYRRSCTICPGQYDILHPVNGKYLSGKKVPVMEGELAWCWGTHLELPFTGRQAQAGRRYEDLRRGTGLFRCSQSTGYSVSFAFFGFLGHSLSGRLCVEASRRLTSDTRHGVVVKCFLFFSDFSFAVVTSEDYFE